MLCFSQLQFCGIFHVNISFFLLFLYFLIADDTMTSNVSPLNKQEYNKVIDLTILSSDEEYQASMAEEVSSKDAGPPQNTKSRKRLWENGEEICDSEPPQGKLLLCVCLCVCFFLFPFFLGGEGGLLVQ